MKKDDLELFERAMETLGVKPQPKEKTPNKAPSGPAMPTLPDDDLDFDAIMRTSRGPAKLERPAAKKASASASTTPEQAAPRDPASFDPGDYAATEEERALFAAAMANEQAMGERAVSSRPVREPTTGKIAKPESLAARIKRRGIEIEAQLDLHGKTRAEAEPRVRAFLEECVHERWEIVAIVCGRGVHSDGGRPVLKPLVTAWLREEYRAWAAEVVEAPAALGGSGTLIVRVRLDVRG